MTHEKLTVLLSEGEIQKKIEELAEQINADFAGEDLTVVFSLTGAIFFGVDLVRHLQADVSLDTLSISSYSGTKSTGNIKINSDLKTDISGKNVLIVEDIVDTGLTLMHLKAFIEQRKPARYKIASLLDKPKRRVIENISADYTGFFIEDFFVVGYGLDYNERYRNLRNISVLSFD